MLEANSWELRLNPEGVRLAFGPAESFPLSIGSSLPEVVLIPGGFDFSRRNHLGSEVSLIGPGAVLNFWHLVNFRNRHHTAAAWPEIVLAAHAETTTRSDDWQFAPHPSLVVFERADLKLVIGMAGVFAGDGLRIDIRGNTVNRFTFAGAVDEPRIRMQLFEGDVFQAVSQFVSGLPVTPRATPQATWATEPVYGTWFDQVYRSEVGVPADLADQLDDPGWSVAAHVLTEEFVLEAVNVLQKQRLPFRTVMLDVGWFQAIGDWRVATDRFPDMRGLVNRLHDLGYKVVVWWHWAEVGKTADVDPRRLVGGGWQNRHGTRLYDYSSPWVQQEFLPELFHKMFSPDPGCLDFDGIKTDFLADKVHPETPWADPQWGGEERYFENVCGLVYAEMRKQKADAAHVGCSGHWALGPFIDVNRTYDVHSTNPEEHVSRARMLRATCPDVPVAFDFHPYTENLDAYFNRAKDSGCGVQVGNVLHTRRDPWSAIQIADAAYWAALRRGLDT